VSGSESVAATAAESGISAAHASMIRIRAWIVPAPLRMSSPDASPPAMLPTSAAR